MTLLDTNILIEILKGNQNTVKAVESMSERAAISAITVMELYYGALNKAELREIERFVALFHILHLNETISQTSIKLVHKYAKSHSLDIPDSIIAATAITCKCPLFTYNTKDFSYIEGLTLFKI